VLVLRLWRESHELATAKPEWRGTIFDVVTRVQQPFRGLPGMVSAVRDLVSDTDDDDDTSGRDWTWWRWLTRQRRR